MSNKTVKTGIPFVDKSGNDVMEWLSSSEIPPVRYLTAQQLIRPKPSERTLRMLRGEMLAWKPLRQILTLQRDDGSFPYGQKTPTALPTFWALCLMERCGMEVEDEPAARALAYLSERHLGYGALSYTFGGSGILPCYVGVMSRTVIRMGGFDTPLVRQSVRWLLDHQRFDHKEIRAGGPKKWRYKAVENYGCWQSVSCYHGVAGAFLAFAAIPARRRTLEVKARLDEAIEYLRIHRLYKRSAGDRQLFRHLTQFFIVGDYRSNLLDMLEGLADADPKLGREDWVREAVRTVEALAPDGKVVLVKNYGKKLVDPIPFEPIGKPSRFLTYRWQCVRRKFGL